MWKEVCHKNKSVLFALILKSNHVLMNVCDKQCLNNDDQYVVNYYAFYLKFDIKMNQSINVHNVWKDEW